MKKIILLALLAAGPCQAANLAGLWLFDDQANLGKATVGNDLTFTAPAPGNWAASLADDGSASLSGVITTPAASSTTRFTATHGIPANGGGAFVNEYSIVVDLFSPVASRSSWRTIMQTNVSNANDGDYFIDPTNTVGVFDLTYSAGTLNPAAWTRLVITFDLGTGVASYTNGTLLHNHSAVAVDGRFSLDPTVLFFTDNDGDNAPLHIGALAIYDGVLTPAEVSTLGVAGAAIPEPSVALLGLAALGGLAGLRRRRA
jgi:MYXO-CTERM domain-containing protein